ncbi:MAG: ATP-binding protein [Oscillatoriales cyanobacterium]|uniref:histidine kinase n=1 Tax=Microcoleus anatoxicus PTRS2 TaxID=2705321 RepID=A0ABU8YJW7_9CYAN|nr:MAG: ATP-binding protein [Oscillatoriales cyanobacterium]TAD97852.1 MAG: ATP-binding protein [Oscillatoriales cyanobacterium]TAE05099.1 MAG: ATP-binding protein [Oscillatoriales cyanobacterium]TAF00079.1 MAG: ATP-binding protein [Oscillatoriales cyanobacterium]TAF47015.1 MAG: ATP-binding protein [Oscillatoriales cyanobacterium]
MFALHEFNSELSVLHIPEICTWNLSLESTLLDLPLYNCQIELTQQAKEVAQAFDKKPLLPGVILTDRGKFVGIISRRLFFERVNRRYGIEMFFKRPIEVLYRFSRKDMLILSGTKLIVEAAEESLYRPAELVYDPIVVEVAPETYWLLDVQQLMVAQSKIHQLTNKLLQKQTEAKLIQTEKMASLGNIIAGVAHEIRNPLNCIWGNLNFLLSYFEDLLELMSAYEEEFSEPSPVIAAIKERIEFDFLREDLPATLEGMKFGAEQLLKIVNSLHNFSHMDESKPFSTDIHECIENTLLILKNRLKQSTEVVKNYGDMPLIKCYSGQLSQVFLNLLINALDALAEGASDREMNGQYPQNWYPRIEITTKVVEVDDRKWAAIIITDNGPGIPPEIQEQIFETFFTTKPVGKGTGMGLAICHQIITEKHAGKLNLRSQPAPNTEFEILLPIVQTCDRKAL